MRICNDFNAIGRKLLPKLLTMLAGFVAGLAFLTFASLVIRPGFKARDAVIAADTGIQQLAGALQALNP